MPTHQCPRCQQTFMAESTGRLPQCPNCASPPADDGWYFRSGGHVFGPVTPAMLEELAESGVVRKVDDGPRTPSAAEMSPVVRADAATESHPVRPRRFLSAMTWMLLAVAAASGWVFHFAREQDRLRDERLSEGALSLDVVSQKPVQVVWARESHPVAARKPMQLQPNARQPIRDAEVLAEPFFVEAESFSKTGGTYQGFKVNDVLGNINFNQTGDWVEYDIEFPEKGTYQVLLDAGTPLDGAGVEILIDNVRVDSKPLPNTGMWDTMRRTIVSNRLPVPKAGHHIIRIRSIGKPHAWQWNADKLGFRKLTSKVNRTKNPERR